MRVLLSVVDVFSFRNPFLGICVQMEWIDSRYAVAEQWGCEEVAEIIRGDVVKVLLVSFGWGSLFFVRISG